MKTTLEERRVLEIIRIKLLCRIRGLETDFKVTKEERFKFAAQEFEEMYRHLDELKWIKADIECAWKYLSDEERKYYEQLITPLHNSKKEKKK